jgi:hypothetical protein
MKFIACLLHVYWRIGETTARGSRGSTGGETPEYYAWRESRMVGNAIRGENEVG